MADIKQTAADNAETDKGKRRTSFVRGLHVPNISRMVKQFEVAASGDHSPSRSTTPNRPRGAELDRIPPARSASSCETGRPAEDSGGAEIPDIPLRRSSNTINSDFTAPSMSTLERFLVAGGMQNGPHPGPLNFHPFQLPNNAAEKETSHGNQYHVPDERSLYPLTECSWESSQPDDDCSELSDEPSVESENQSLSPPQLQQRDKLALVTSFTPRRDRFFSGEHSVNSPESSSEQHAVSPYNRELAPTRLAESRSTSTMTGTSSPYNMDMSPTSLAESRSISVMTGTSTQTYQPDGDDDDDEPLPPLPPLQAIGVDDPDALHPVGGEDLDPTSFDLVVPPVEGAGMYKLEHRSVLLFSVEHMQVIISDPSSLHRFSSFLGAYRPQSVPLLHYTLEALKAIRAMDYANDIISRSLRPADEHQMQIQPPVFAAQAAPELVANDSLRRKAHAAFEALAKEDLPAYITHTWTEIAELSMRRKMTGMMPENLQNSSEGLAEVFCISDPSREDNPMVFASEGNSNPFSSSHFSFKPLT